MRDLKEMVEELRSKPSQRWISKRENLFLFQVFMASCILFALGLFLPVMTLTKFFVFNNTFSILSSIYSLVSSGKLFLFLIISLFSVVMPMLKLRLIYVLIRAKGRVDKKSRRWLHLMHEYSRWGMLDVFVVVMILVAVKLGALAKVEVHVGLYCFGLAVLLIMFLTYCLSKIYAPIESAMQSKD